MWIAKVQSFGDIGPISMKVMQKYSRFGRIFLIMDESKYFTVFLQAMIKNERIRVKTDVLLQQDSMIFHAWPLLSCS
ncbi:hypothetical protein J2TS4_41210 [Paenibacillus sp. J2TS4]|nr:hypothetical protein J2TS4_41210 [Paenibacillus sp. J2TS4]